ncbi:MAG: hypothetical protein ACLR8Y_14305 [Alistipes indistinctus]
MGQPLGRNDDFSRHTGQRTARHHARKRRRDHCGPDTTRPEASLSGYPIRKDTIARTRWTILRAVPRRKRENGRVRITITNYKRSPGTYTMRLTATDLGGAVTTLDIPLTLEASQPPQLTAPLENVYFSSLQEVATLYFSSNFSDERGAAAITYTLDYDDQALYITPQNRGFKIAPLRYGPAEVTVTASATKRDSRAPASFQVMSRDYTREVDLYPNPVQDKLSIRMGKEVSGEIRITGRRSPPDRSSGTDRPPFRRSRPLRSTFPH